MDRFCDHTGLDQMIPDLMKLHAVPGLCIAVIRDRAISWARGFGVRDLWSNQAMNADTVFEGGSLSKPVFAYAALRMCETGTLDLDKPMTEYLPEAYIRDELMLNLITARMVLAHITGFENWRAPEQPLKMLCAPGIRFTYSGEAYFYLQRVIEHLSGQSFSDLMRLSIFEPFEMSNSSYTWRNSYEKEAALSYSLQGELDLSLMWRSAHDIAADSNGAISCDRPELAIPNAASSLYTSANDFAKFMAVILSNSKNDAFRLSENIKRQMLTPHIDVSNSISWGLGWGIERCARGDCFFHWANQNSFQHFALMFANEGFGAVIMTNSANGLKVCDAVVRRLIQTELDVLSYLIAVS